MSAPSEVVDFLFLLRPIELDWLTTPLVGCLYPMQGWGKAYHYSSFYSFYHLSKIVKPWIPDTGYDLFPQDAAPRARQVILTLDRPEEGVTAHVGLLNRFDNGVIGVSFHSSNVITLQRMAQHDDFTAGWAHRRTQLLEASLVKRVF